jgi:phage gpG-like protein
MQFTITVENFEPELRHAFDQLQNRPTALRQVLGAMAAKFKYLCMMNTGFSGIDRPHEWDALSPRYAKRVHRDFATMDLTGNLMRSIRMQVHPDYSEVFIAPDDCPYASRHQWGDEIMPARPFFPMTEDGLTPYAEQEVVSAAQDMLAESLSEGPYIGPIY